MDISDALLGVLPNTAELMAFTWRFNLESSSATGLRADSRLQPISAMYPSQCPNWHVQSWILLSVVLWKLKRLEVLLWLGRFFLMRFDTLLKISNLCPLMVYVSLPKSRGAFQYFIQSPKDSYKFQSWHLGANADCFFLTAYSKSRGFIQVSILALGG